MMISENNIFFSCVSSINMKHNRTCWSRADIILCNMLVMGSSWRGRSADLGCWCRDGAGWDARVWCQYEPSVWPVITTPVMLVTNQLKVNKPSTLDKKYFNILRSKDVQSFQWLIWNSEVKSWAPRYQQEESCSSEIIWFWFIVIDNWAAAVTEWLMCWVVRIKYEM